MASHPEERDALARLIQAVGRRTAPPPQDYQRVLRASREVWMRTVMQRRRRRWTYALAAALLLALGLTWLQRYENRPPPMFGTLVIAEGGVFVGSAGGEEWHWLTTRGSGIQSGKRLRTDSSGRASLALDASTSLRLGPSTDLLLQPRRRVELISGRVYFDARSHAGSGIEIVTRFGTLRDVGTQFEVLASAESLRIRTREGAVILTRPNSDAELICAFSEELRIGAGGNVERSRIAPHDADWAWVETLSEPPQGAQVPLRQFLDWVVRESGRRLLYDSPATEARVGQVMLHGTTPNLAPVKALEVTLATTDIDFVLLDDGTILLRPRRAR